MKDKVNMLFNEVDPDKKYSTTVNRIGKQKPESNDDNKDKYSKPIRVVFSGTWEKRLFLSKLRNLRDNEKYANVRVSHDMGMEDRDENRRLLREAYKLNQENKDPNFKFKVRGPPWAMEIKKVKKN